jgi:hypothetical protein
MFRSIKKSMKLSKLSQILGERPTHDGWETMIMSGGMDGVSDFFMKQDSALNELIGIAWQDPVLSKVIRKYSTTQQELKDLYRKLIENGADRWAEKHWVAASTFTFAGPLEYLLKNKHGNLREVSYRLWQYFDSKSVGDIS